MDNKEIANESVLRALKGIWQDGYDKACSEMSEKIGWHDSEERPEDGRTILVASIDPEDGVYYYAITVDYGTYSSLMPAGTDKWMYIFSPMG